MQSEEHMNREQSRLDYNLARIHGEMVNFDILGVDEKTGRFKCIATFADNFEHASLRTRAQVVDAQHCMQAKQHKQEKTDQMVASRRFTALPRPQGQPEQPFQVDRSHMMRGQQPPAHLTTPNLQNTTLVDYARSTPQRNRLLNGKLFTRQLLGSIDHKAIPDAMK